MAGHQCSQKERFEQNDRMLSKLFRIMDGNGSTGLVATVAVLLKSVETLETTVATLQKEIKKTVADLQKEREAITSKLPTPEKINSRIRFWSLVGSGGSTGLLFVSFILYLLFKT